MNFKTTDEIREEDTFSIATDLDSEVISDPLLNCENYAPLPTMDESLPLSDIGDNSRIFASRGSECAILSLSATPQGRRSEAMAATLAQDSSISQIVDFLPDDFCKFDF